MRLEMSTKTVSIVKIIPQEQTGALKDIVIVFSSDAFAVNNKTVSGARRIGYCPYALEVSTGLVGEDTYINDNTKFIFNEEYSIEIFIDGVLTGSISGPVADGTIDLSVVSTYSNEIIYVINIDILSHNNTSLHMALDDFTSVKTVKSPWSHISYTGVLDGFKIKYRQYNIRKWDDISGLTLRTLDEDIMDLSIAYPEPSIPSSPNNHLDYYQRYERSVVTTGGISQIQYKLKLYAFSPQPKTQSEIFGFSSLPKTSDNLYERRIHACQNNQQECMKFTTYVATLNRLPVKLIYLIKSVFAKGRWFSSSYSLHKSGNFMIEINASDLSIKPTHFQYVDMLWVKAMDKWHDELYGLRKVPGLSMQFAEDFHKYFLHNKANEISIFANITETLNSAGIPTRSWSKYSIAGMANIVNDINNALNAQGTVHIGCIAHDFKLASNNQRMLTGGYGFHENLVLVRNSTKTTQAKTDHIIQILSVDDKDKTIYIENNSGNLIKMENFYVFKIYDPNTGSFSNLFIKRDYLSEYFRIILVML